MANTHALAIPDAFPISPGHTLIIPKRLAQKKLQNAFGAVRKK